MKKIMRRMLCFVLTAVIACSSMATTSFAEYDRSDRYSTDPSTGIKHEETLYGASYVGMNIYPDLLYKDYINPEYETKIVLWYFTRSVDDITPIIEYAKTFGTDIPVEISTEPYPYGAWGNYCGSIVWNNGHPDADPVGTEYYYAEPDYAITPVVNGTTTVSDSSSLKEFSDVPKTEYYYNAVRWGTSIGVVNGTGDTTFSPDQTCTHAQILTFIYRYMGNPAPSASSMPYSNVKSSEYYYNAVLWAYGKGVLTADTFDPNAPCTRADTVLYLYRTAVSNPSTGSAATKFEDVDANAVYAPAVLWASENGIVNGTGSTTFSPDQTCTRAQIITILHRYAGTPEPVGSTTTTVGYKYAPDVPDNYKYADAINYCIENRILKLGDDGLFHPDRTVSIGELMSIFNRIRGWRYADDDYNWDGKWSTEHFVDYNGDGMSDYYERLWGGTWEAANPSTYTIPYLFTAKMLGYDFTDPEPWWFKDSVSLLWICTQRSMGNNYSNWVEKPLNKSAFYACLGGFCLNVLHKTDRELPIVCDLPDVLYPYQVFPEILAGMGFDVDTLKKADENSYCSGWGTPRASYAFRYGFITAENSSTMADEITLGEVCKCLYDLGFTYNCRWIYRTVAG